MEPFKGVSVPQPCNASWDGMSPGNEGRFCSLCSKTVIDFTQKTTAEIKSFLGRNKQKRICGRFRKEQVEEKQTFFPKSPPLWIFAVAILYAFGESLFDMNRHALTQVISPSDVREIKDGETHTMGIIMPPPPSHKIASYTNQLSIPDPDGKDSLGTIKIRRVGGEVFTSWEVDPVFPGGNTALLNFLQDRVKYPKEDLDQGRSAFVVVQFIIRPNGKVSDVIILKSGGKNFDREVIRVVNTLPKFKPALIAGKPVAVYYTMPVRFILP
jgi:TonB family protein